MTSKQTWSLAEGYYQFEAKFRTLMIKETLSATNFRFVAKIQRKSVLCSNEMSLNRPRTFDRIFVRTFDERSLKQITKFAEFRLHYFCTILYIWTTEPNFGHFCRKHLPLMTFDGVEVSVLLTPFIIAALTALLSSWEKLNTNQSWIRTVFSS